MADITEAIRRLIYEYVVEGADKVMATQEAVAASTVKTDKASLSLEKAFGSLERRYVETVRHQQDYAKVQDKVNAAVAQNPALQERANVLLAAAGEHFDKLAVNAGKGGIAASFLSKAISGLLGPAGLMGVAMTAVGTAVGYMAAQFQSASTTIEQALEEQNRLVKEAKTLLDAKSSAEAKANAQSRELTQFQLLQSQLDLREKLKKVMEDTAGIAARQDLTPARDPGEMGALQPMAAQGLPGFDQVTAAVEKFNTALAAGQPGVAAFQTELARLALLHPELTATVQELMKVSNEGIKLEQGSLQAKAMADALAGVATDAQMAAAGLGSLAQHAVNSQMAIEAADATERQAKATLQLAAAYPGMSIEAAKQLQALEGQLQVAQARTGAEQMVAQELVTISNLLLQNKTLEEATAIAAAQRAVAEANVEKTIEKQIQALEDQVKLSKARVNGTEAAVKAEIAYRNALEQTNNADLASRVERATLDADRAREQERYGQGVRQATAWVQEHNNAIAQAESKAAALRYEWERIPGVIIDINREIGNVGVTIKNLPQFKTWTDPNTGQQTQFNPEGTQFGTLLGNVDAMAKTYGMENLDIKTTTISPGLSVRIATVKPSYWEQQKIKPITPYEHTKASPGDFVGGLDISSPAAIQQSFQKVLALGFKDLSPLDRFVDAVGDPATQASLIQQAIERVQTTQPPSLARSELVNELNDKLEELAKSTDSLNATMQNALSPYYSQDPRTTRLGFRAGVVANPDWMAGGTNANPLAAILGPTATVPGLANGGSFTVGGGYSANDNRMAVFPVACGEEVVVNRNRRQGSGGNVINIDNRTIVMGSVDADTMSKLKVTQYQQSQRMRGALAQG